MSDAHPNPARWLPDPTGRHQYRYWDGERWTDHVSDYGMTGSEPVTATGPVTPVGAATYAGESSGGGPLAGAPYGGAPYGGAPHGGGWGAGYPVPAYATAAHAGDPTRVLGRRYGAFFIDLAVLFALAVVLFSAFAIQRTVPETLALPGCHYQSANSSIIQCDNRAVVRIGDTVYELDDNGSVFALELVFGFLYFGVLQGLVGATLGKLATGVRVVKADGSVVGVPRAVVRWLLLAVDGPLTFFLCGIITTSVSRGHRRAGDMVAGTYVVARERVGLPVAL